MCIRDRSTYFDVVGKLWGKATSLQNFVGQSSKTTKLCAKNPKIMGGVTLRGPLAQKLTHGPSIFSFLESALDVLSTCKVIETFHSFPGRIQESNLENPKIRKKFPRNWGLGMGPPVLELK